jgi:phosphatidyl-myo-inositol dimannoside synthase
MGARTNSIVALFPGLNAVGGIQVAALESWRAIASRWPEARLIVFGGGSPEAGEGAIAEGKKLRLCVKVLRQRWDADQALFGHVDLLKLLPLLRGFRGRVSLMLYGIDAWRRPGWLTRRLLRRVDQFLTISHFTWDRFLEFNPAFQGCSHRVVHLGLGVPAVELPAPGAEPAALIIGRMSRSEDYKGHRELIAAWPAVRARVPNATLWIVGDGDLRADLEVLASQRGVGDSVKFWGRVSDGEKQRLIANCRCLAMPSRAEGFGLVYLEAMRVGRPCLVSDRDAGREVVAPPEAGLAVDPDRLEELADALVRLLSSGPEWDCWSAAARARYERQFTADHYRQRLLSALDVAPNPTE